LTSFGITHKTKSLIECIFILTITPWEDGVILKVVEIPVDGVTNESGLGTNRVISHIAPERAFTTVLTLQVIAHQKSYALKLA